MPIVTFIEPNGSKHRIEVKSGTTARDAAVGNSVPGIDGDCGGACACATCHVYVDPMWIDKTGLAEVDGMEDNLLQFAADPRGNSRLACQIPVTDALDGLVLFIPEGQH